jgi:acyl-CoA synthetase (AMP-forming)/AMP-acid ligase II
MAFLIGGLLDNAASAVPRRIAATLDDESITFGEIDRRAGRMANALKALGLGRGDRVLFWGTISLTCYDVFFGTARIGAAFAPVNPGGSIEEICPIAEYVQPHLLIVDRDHEEQGYAIANSLGVRLAVLDAGTHSVAGINLSHETERAAEVYRGEGPSENDPHVIFFTSGSTGRPKGVLIPHRAGVLRAHSLQNQATSGGGGDVSMFPLFHMAGWTQITASMAHLRPVHLTRRADAEILLGNVERWRARRLYCIPAVWERVLACTSVFDTRSLGQVLTGTYRVDPALLEALKVRFPGTLRQIIYGSTEAGIVIGLDHDEIDLHPDTVGLPVPGVRARLAADGELQVTSDCIMSGYFALPQETAEVLRDGWYSTGDLAERGEDGHYRIIGRVREVIRSGGETISPAEVEAAVASLPNVRQVAVVGLPNSEWGEIVCAALVMEEGAPLPSREAMRKHLAPRLATFKHPRDIVALSSLPLTLATQQIQRGKVRELLLAQRKAESA